MKIIKCVYESGAFALPIMFFSGGFVWVTLGEALFQLEKLLWWF